MLDEHKVLTSKKRAPSSVTLVVGGLILALVAVMAIPVFSFWLGAESVQEELPGVVEGQH